jgi:hypothetical protein
MPEQVPILIDERAPELLSRWDMAVDEGLPPFLPEAPDPNLTKQFLAKARAIGHSAASAAKKITAGTLAGVMTGGSLVPLAEASSQDTTPVDPYNTSALLVMRHAKKNAFEVATKNIIVGEDVRLKKGVNLNNCHWTKGAFTNSMRLPNGRLKYYRDDKRGYLCRSSTSPTGWVKVKGGETGRVCYNPAKDKPIAESKSEILNVRSLSTSFVLKITVNPTAEAICPGATATGSVRGEISQRFNLRNYLRKSGTSQSKLIFKLRDQAILKAEAEASCSSVVIPFVPPNTPPPQTINPNRPPSVTVINKPEHVIDTDQQQLCATKFDPDGDKLGEQFTAALGNVSAPYYPDITTQPNKVCTIYTPPDLPPGTTAQETVSVTVSDGSLTAGDSVNFTLVDDGIRPFKSERKVLL